MAYLSKCDDISGCGRVYPTDLTTCPDCGASVNFSNPALVNIRDYLYDIETYPNIFTCAFIHVATGDRWIFEISDRMNQISEFVNFCAGLRQLNARLIGYNNEFFDYPVIHHILENPSHACVESIYFKAMSIINSNQRFDNFVWPRDRFITQIDLFKIHHFDNKAKRTSLKALEIAMCMENIKDLPFPVGKQLLDSEKDVLRQYNFHDVEATGRFYARSVSMIQLRDDLSESLGLDFMNKSDVKMGEMILVNELEKRGISTTERVGGKKIKRQTHRASIDLNDVIFPYVKFERPEFEMVRAYLASRVITQTKGVFNEIPCTREMIRYMDPERVRVYGYSGPKYAKRKGITVTVDHNTKAPLKLSTVATGLDQIPNECRFEADNLHCVIDGFRFDFGTGGLHASRTAKIYKTNDAHTIVDVDVASFYPNLGIKNKLYPAHLSVDFCDAYLGVYETRKSYPKKAPENGAFKLALNGAYGGSNNEFSPFYDPFYTMSITINGQLLLCMLVEQIIKIPGVEMIQCNTDGITYYCPNDYLEHQRAVCRWWEKLTLLELEEALYSRMFIRDVNSYIAEYLNDGKLKRIGAYAHVTPDEEPATREVVWSKDPSALIVPKVAERVLVEGVDPRSLIESWGNPYDFMIRAKVGRSDKLVMRWSEYDGVEMTLQNTTRYFVSTSGGELIKISPPSGELETWKRKAGIKDSFYDAVMIEILAGPHEGERDALGVPWDERIHTGTKSKHETRETGLCAGWRVTDCADIKDFDKSAINVDYYIEEVNKLTTPLIEGN